MTGDGVGSGRRGKNSRLGHRFSTGHQLVRFDGLGGGGDKVLCLNHARGTLLDISDGSSGIRGLTDEGFRISL